MKANELMIGDWVCYKGRTQIPARVVSFNNQTIKFDNGTPQDWLSSIENFEPIPLTAEILGKNFSFSPYNSEGAIEHYYLLGGYYDVEISEYTDGLWEVVVDEVEMSRLPTWKMYVCHVHELQHALRLCGINKEIII